MTFDRSWQARWIWVPEEAPPPATSFNLDPLERPADTVAYLRRTFEVHQVPAAAPCRITADGRYRLFVNGTELGRGPVRGEPSHLAWDQYDLASHLMTGINVIGIVARHFGTATLYWKPAHPSGDLGFGGVLLEAQVGDDLVVTDESWTARLAPYERANPGRWVGPPAVEVFDARNDDRDWLSATFDDSAWSQVRVLRPFGLAQHTDAPPFDPFSLLDAAPIGQLDQRVVQPRRVVGRGGAFRHPDLPPRDCFNQDGMGRRVDEVLDGPLTMSAGEWLTLDFEELTNSHPIIEVDAPAGTVIDLSCGEDLHDDGSPVVEPRRWIFRFIAAGDGRDRIESLEPVGFRFLQVAVRHGDARSLTLETNYRHYPRPAGPTFQCDDGSLTELWKVGAQTLDACAVDAFLDCPGREQRAWVGDAYVESLVSLVCNSDTGLVTRNADLIRQGARSDGLRPMVAGGDFSDSMTTIIDFSLHWIRTVVRTYEHLGDVAFAERMWPRVLDALSWFEFHRGPDDLLVDLTGWAFVDWAQTERGRHIAAIDALHVLALDDAAVLADGLGDLGTAARLRDRAERTRQAFERYWDADRGVYVDAASPDGWTGRRVSQQTNTLAILSGAAPQERWSRMLERILDQDRLLITRHPGDGGPQQDRLLYQWMRAEPFGGGDPMDEEEQVVQAQPFFCHFLHQALAQAGEIDALFASLRRWEPLVARGDQVLHEYWDHVPGHGSRCHAWSATPTWDLTTHVAGVRRRTVGWSEVEIAPHFGPLASVAATVPTPLGDITVDLRRGEGGTVVLPEGMKGTYQASGKEIALAPGSQAVPC